jgi:thioredoxin reductase (NADPH)
MAKRILLAVHDQPGELQLVQQELTSRYGDHYEVVGEPSPESALHRLAVLGKTPDAEVLVIFAAEPMAAMTGTDFLARAHPLHPHAQRVLLIPWGNRSETKPVLKAISLGKIDRFTYQPGRSPDERFRHLVSELLWAWQQQQQDQPTVVTMIGDRWTPRTYELRDLLQRGGLRFAFHSADSAEGRALLREVGHPEGPFLILVRFNGEALTNPTNEEASAALGVRHASTAGVFDLVVVGAGPAGLSAAVSGASEGLRILVLDRESIGGQAGTSSHIRNYPGFPVGISGAELCNRVLDQAWSFGAETSVLRRAVDLRVDGDHRVVELADGTDIVARAVVLATGATYQRLGIPAAESLIGAGVFYGGGVTEAQAMQGQHVHVIGAGNSAGQAAVHLAKYAHRVTMVVRGAALETSMSDYLIQIIDRADNIEVWLNTTLVDAHGTDHLQAVVLRNSATGETRTVATAALFVLIGARPHTDWLPASIERDERGFIRTGADAITPSARPALLRQPLPQATC